MKSVPPTMRASVLVAPHDLRDETVDVPQVNSDQVLVRIAAVGVCGSDIHYFESGRIGSFVVNGPLILGHESSGVIVAEGDEVVPSRIGQRVSIEPQRPCRTCRYCKSGQYNLCPSMEFYATPPIDGAFAEYAAIQSDFAHEIPDSMSFEAAALIEPFSVGIWACKKAGIAAGSSVLITGAGPIGIMVAQAARAFGATRIVISDPVSGRRDVAVRYGATQLIDPLVTKLGDRGLEVDAFIDASGSAIAVQSGIREVRPGGVVVLVGMGADDYSLPISTIQNRELLVTGVFRYANTWPTAIELVRSGAVDLDSLVTGRFGMNEVESALLPPLDPDSVLKSIVYPNGMGG